MEQNFLEYFANKRTWDGTDMSCHCFERRYRLGHKERKFQFLAFFFVFAVLSKSVINSICLGTKVQERDVTHLSRRHRKLRQPLRGALRSLGFRGRPTRLIIDYLL